MKTLWKSGVVGLAIAMISGLGAVSVSTDAKAWESKKPVQFVIMAGKGGGADKAVRFVTSIRKSVPASEETCTLEAPPRRSRRRTVRSLTSS